MKKYTHAYLAFMAIKRLQYGPIPEANKADAQSLVKWFHDYRDFVVKGSWYPDEVFKDNTTSHIIKFRPDQHAADHNFKKLPRNMQQYSLGLSSPLYNQPFVIEMGNLADRCESLAHGVIDCLKMLRMEDRGCPISPSNNHIAMRFFILSHYIADCHMPLHCDARPFSDGENIHAFIESQWETQIKKSYQVDTANERFFYDPYGYPLLQKPTSLIQSVEDDILQREFLYSWGTGNSNTWDYMSAVSQYSYLMAYHMIPSEYNENNLTKEVYKKSQQYARFEQDSRIIFCDAIDSIARVWLHAWARYRSWEKNKK